MGPCPGRWYGLEGVAKSHDANGINTRSVIVVEQSRQVLRRFSE